MLENEAKPIAYNSSSGFPSKVFLVIIFIAAIAISFFGGYLISQKNNLNIQPATVATNVSQQMPTSSPSALNLPIDIESSAVKSLWLVYSLSGVVDSITPTTINNIQGYNFQILSPTGPLVNQTFFASDKTTNIVFLDKTDKETKYELSAVKKGDSIQISYQIDSKNQSQSQITKITILK